METCPHRNLCVDGCQCCHSQLLAGGNSPAVCRLVKGQLWSAHATECSSAVETKTGHPLPRGTRDAE